MALSRAAPGEIPKDAVILSEEKALIHQWKIISNWDKWSDVWALNYTPGILASFAACTGIFVNNHFRKKLQLGSFGRFSTYLPIVVVPAIFTVLCHKAYIQRFIIIDPMKECPTCIQLTAAALQAGFGVIYPTVLAPFATCMFATRHYTYDLPSIIKKPKEVFNLLRKFTKPIIPTLGMLLIGQSLVTVYLTYKEQKQSIDIITNMRNFEKQMEQELGI